MVLEGLSWRVTCPNHASFRLLAYKEAGLAPHSAVGLVLQVEDADKFPQALCFESMDFFFFSRVSKQGPCFTATEEDGGDKRLVQLELARDADGVSLPDPV